jgi:AraC family transcriptional regulator
MGKSPPQSIAIHPLDLPMTDWVTSRQRICLEGLTIEQGVQTPHKIEAAFTHHVLGIITSEGNQQEIIRIGDQEYIGNFPKGSGFLSPVHADYFSAWKSTDTGINFIFDPISIAQIAEHDLGFRQNHVELLSTPFVQDAQVSIIANLFQQEMQTGGMGGQLYAESLCNILIVHLLRHYCAFSPVLEAPSNLSSSQLNQVISYVETHLSQNIPLSCLAQIARMSKYHFSRSFKKSTGITPHQYILRRRVERAKQLLQQSPASVLDVALACGFAHPGHLSRHFKRLVGMTPKKFQQQ